MTQQPPHLLNRNRKHIIICIAAGIFSISSISLASLALQNRDASAAMAAPEFPSSFADLAERVRPAVVNIATTQGKQHQRSMQYRRHSTPLPHGLPFDQFFQHFFQQPLPEHQSQHARTSGSGFIIDSDGHIVTNYHVVKHADEIQVTRNDGNQYQAKMIGFDEKSDLAVIKINTNDTLSGVSFSAVDKARVGDWVVAVGNPFGLGGTVTAGIISARGRDLHAGPFDDFIQIDAPINRGNSGGPLFNVQGQVIGINTAIVSPNGGSVGIGFAIPATIAQPIIEQLKNQGHITRGWLGVQIQPVTAAIAENLDLNQTDGALIADVIKNSPAAAAELLVGDIILAIDDTTVKHTKDVVRIIANATAGHRIALKIWRHGQPKTINATLALLQDDQQHQSHQDESGDQPESGNHHLGLHLEKRNNSRHSQGAVVTALKKNSPAANSQLQIGDIIIMIDQTQVTGPNDVYQNVAKAIAANKESILLLVSRNQARMFLTVTIS